MSFDRDTLSPDIIHRLRAVPALDHAVQAFAAWWEHVDGCTACWWGQGDDGAHLRLCATADDLLSEAIARNVRAMSARQWPPPGEDQDPAELVGQPWRAPVGVGA